MIVIVTSILTLIEVLCVDLCLESFVFPFTRSFSATTEQQEGK